MLNLMKMMKYYEIINGVRIEFNTIDIENEDESEILNLYNIDRHSDEASDNEEFYDTRYWDDVNGVWADHIVFIDDDYDDNIDDNDDDVLLPNLNENYFAEQDEIKIKFPINDNNLHN